MEQQTLGGICNDGIQLVAATYADRSSQRQGLCLCLFTTALRVIGHKLSTERNSSQPVSDTSSKDARSPHHLPPANMDRRTAMYTCVIAGEACAIIVNRKTLDENVCAEWHEGLRLTPG